MLKYKYILTDSINQYKMKKVKGELGGLMKITMTDEVRAQLLTAMKNANKEAIRFLFEGFGKQGPSYAMQLDNILRSTTDVVLDIDGIKYIIQREYQLALKNIEIVFEENKFIVRRKATIATAGLRADLTVPGQVTFGVNAKDIIDE